MEESEMPKSHILYSRAGDWGELLARGCGAYAAGYLLWLVFQWGGEDYRGLIRGLASLPILLVAGLLAWRASTHTALDPRTRRGWRILALAYLLCWLGDALWFYSTVVLDTRPAASWADVA